MKDLNSGQFMLEVIVAVGVIVLLATGLVTATTASLRSNQKSRMKNEAVRYVEDGMELVRKDRDTNPSAFFGRADGSYCLGDGIGPNSQFTTPVASNCSTTNITSTNYIRTVDITANGSGKDATVKVSWTEGTITTSTQTMSTFTPWKTPTAFTPLGGSTPVIILNSASNKTCNTRCLEQGKTFMSCGTDASTAINGSYYRKVGTHCSRLNNCETTSMTNSNNGNCNAIAASWTYCKCQ